MTKKTTQIDTKTIIWLAILYFQSALFGIMFALGLTVLQEWGTNKHFSKSCQFAMTAFLAALSVPGLLVS